MSGVFSSFATDARPVPRFLIMLLVQSAGARAHDGAIAVGYHERTTVGIGDANYGIIIRRRGARLEGFEDGPAALARAGPHSGLSVDADQLDPGGHPERNCRLVGEREFQEIPR